MQNMNYYYDFSGQKFGYPLSLSINSFERFVFSRIHSLEICYVLKGEYEVITEYFTGVVKQHELVLIAPDDIHKICKHSDDENVVLTIHIDFSRFPHYMVGQIQDSFVSMICTKKTHHELLSAFEKCISKFIQLLQNEDYNLFELNSIMMELVCIASDSKKYSIENLPLISEHNENYMKAIQYIDQHYQEDLHLVDVANTLNFSISYTSKLFKKYTQIPFVKYLSFVRLRASLEALLEGKDSLEKIAHDCGMPNVKAYTNAFKEMYGILPSVYRKQFSQNKKYNQENQDQEMLLEREHLLLLSHLFKSKNVVFEDDEVKISKDEEHLEISLKSLNNKLVIEDNSIQIFKK